MALRPWLKSLRGRCGNRNRSAPDRCRATRALSAELLEPRTLLTVTIAFDDGALTIDLDAADTVTVQTDGDGFVEFQVATGPVVGPAAPVLAADVESLVITGSGGADILDLTGVFDEDFLSLSSIVVNAGGGDDSVTGSLDVGNTLNGEGGEDTLVGGYRGDRLDGGSDNDLLLGQPQSVSAVSNVAVLEGDSGTSNAVITVTLLFVSDVEVTVDYDTADGSATAGEDYETTSGQLTFDPGVTSQTFVVPIIGDTEIEGSESFRVVFSNPVNAALQQSETVVTIFDDEAVAGKFDIQIVFTGGLTDSQEAVFAAAEQRWEEIIVGDLPNFDVPGFGTVDDLVIRAGGEAIDGAGGILGQAGPDDLRPTTFLPASGTMAFDTADLEQMEADGSLFDVILHEMGHVLGSGTIWENLDLLDDPVSAGGTDPRFIGAQATAAYNEIFGVAEAGVPVETEGGPGTADAHWSEDVFGDELMTGFISGDTRPISRVTIAQFADLGYQVDLTQADPFTPALRSAPLSSVSASSSSSGSNRSPSLELPAIEGDVLIGGSGNDTVMAAGGNDQLTGLSGDDSLLGNGGNDTLDGGEDNDTLIGEGGRDFVLGGAGNDSLSGGDGNDWLNGNAGTDTLTETGNVDFTLSLTQLVGLGTDMLANIEAARLIGGDGDNKLTITSFTGSVTLEGSDGDDTLVGGASADSLVGGEGDDQLTGNGGADVLDGEEGDDTVRESGATNYTVTGDTDDATLDTGLAPVTDTLTEIERVELFTANAASRADASGYSGETVLVGGNGKDTLLGGSSNDYINGRGENDELSGNDGDDTILGLAGNDTITGDDGLDSILAGDGKDDVEGGNHADTLDGGSGNDTLDGGAGHDSLLGQADKDSLLGGGGNDTLSGGAHNDTLMGQDDADLILGAAGNDSLEGGGGNDLIDGSDGNDTLRGGTGNDTLLGGNGKDTLAGGEGADSIYGQSGNDAINGGADDDMLNGGDGNDTLLGGDGSDWLQGGLGKDTLRGDAGDDLFDGQAGADRIVGSTLTDTVIPDNQDKLQATINLSAALLAALEVL